MVPSELDLQQVRVRIFRQPLLPNSPGAVIVLPGVRVHENIVTAKIVVVFAEVGGVPAPGFVILPLLDLALLARHCADDLPRHLVLQGQRVLSGLVVALGPDVLARLRVDELGCDADLISLLADAAFQRIVDVEIAADLADVDRFAFVDKGRVARDHREIGKARQHGDDVVAHPVAEIAEALVGAHVVERQDGDRWDMGGGHVRGRTNEAIPARGDEAGEENHRCGDRPRPIRQGGFGLACAFVGRAAPSSFTR